MTITFNNACRPQQGPDRLRIRAHITAAGPEGITLKRLRALRSNPCAGITNLTQLAHQMTRAGDVFVREGVHHNVYFGQADWAAAWTGGPPRIDKSDPLQYAQPRAAVQALGCGLVPLPPPVRAGAQDFLACPSRMGNDLIPYQHTGALHHGQP